MTARLVSNLDRAENGERLPMSAERAETLANVTQFAESLERLLLRDSRDGQLWERVAERSKQAFRNVWRGGMTRGPLARDPYSVASVQGVASGIIRAGERIK